MEDKEKSQHFQSRLQVRENMHSRTFCLRPLGSTSAALLLSFPTTNSSPPLDSEGARSCGCPGALGGAG